MTHTPGPWRLGSRKNAVCDYVGIIIANCEFSHSATNRRKPTGDQCLANARLIAAAPKLLEALQALKMDYADSEGCYCGQLVGGCKADGVPKGACGYCLALDAIADALGQEASK